MWSIYCIVGKFGESSVIHQTKPSNLVHTINNLLADLLIHQTFFSQMLERVNSPNVPATRYTIYLSNIRIDWRNLATILLVFLQASIANKVSSITGRSVKSQILYAIIATVFSSYSNLSLGFLQIHIVGLKWCFYCCNYLSCICICSHCWISKKINGSIMENQSSIFPSILPSTETQ